jgi:hypothetical protein
MAMSENNQSNERYRNGVVAKLMEFFRSKDGGEEWVVQVANNSFGFPFVNDLGNDEILKITVSIPKGDREGNPYDLDGEGADYSASVKKKAELKAKQEEAKAKKIEADKKKREAIAKLKTKQENAVLIDKLKDKLAKGGE